MSEFIQIAEEVLIDAGTLAGELVGLTQGTTEKDASTPVPVSIKSVAVGGTNWSINGTAVRSVQGTGTLEEIKDVLAVLKLAHDFSAKLDSNANISFTIRGIHFDLTVNEAVAK
jgi:hypothetical protein